MLTHIYCISTSKEHTIKVGIPYIYTWPVLQTDGSPVAQCYLKFVWATKLYISVAQVDYWQILFSSVYCLLWATKAKVSATKYYMLVAQLGNWASNFYLQHCDPYFQLFQCSWLPFYILILTSPFCRTNLSFLVPENTELKVSAKLSLWSVFVLFNNISSSAQIWLTPIFTCHR